MREKKESYMCMMIFLVMNRFCWGNVRDNWERLAKEYGLSRGQIENMRPAFNACYDI